MYATACMETLGQPCTAIRETMSMNRRPQTTPRPPSVHRNNPEESRSVRSESEALHNVTLQSDDIHVVDHRHVPRDLPCHLGRDAGHE